MEKTNGEKIMELLRDTHPATSREIGDFLSIPEKVARANISALVRMKKVSKDDQKPARYSLVVEKRDNKGMHEEALKNLDSLKEMFLDIERDRDEAWRLVREYQLKIKEIKEGAKR